MKRGMAQFGRICYNKATFSIRNGITLHTFRLSEALGNTRSRDSEIAPTEDSAFLVRIGGKEFN